MEFEELFRRATVTGSRPRGFRPFPYQVRFASGPLPDMIDVPTGMGKTAAVVLGWLYRSIVAPDTTPRRLVYCLPTRALVNQTAEAARGWIERLRMDLEESTVNVPEVSSLLGGLQELGWVERPEDRAVIVGTQDMLLSRALMRGYGMKRFEWPIHYALLHNDALWVFDETQLMGVGVETSAQLQAFRERLGTARPSRSVWMSATLGRGQLDTIDHPEPAGGWELCSLDEADRAIETVVRRLNAKKALRRSEIHLPSGKSPKYGSAVAERGMALHRPGSLTLIIVNRVERAQAIYRALLVGGRTEEDAALLHSRFRPVDRQTQFDLLTSGKDRIVVSTQVLEAGIDVSAATMLTELAPWPSMVQRFGRCNRYGEINEAQIEWIDLDLEDRKHLNALPYKIDDLTASRAVLRNLEGGEAGPQSLDDVKFEPSTVVRPVVRRKDILELFDTSADLSGNDLDVSRWIRDDEDSDVAFFWREFTGSPHRKQMGEPMREELCSVSITQAHRFLKSDGRTGWWFDRLEGEWTEVRRPRPGQQILIHTGAGGYDHILGWMGTEGRKVVPEVAHPVGGHEAHDDEPASKSDRWISLTRHLDDVTREGETLGKRLGLSRDSLSSLLEACRWHDVGKAHKVFQRLLLDPLEEDGGAISPRPDSGTLWAKSNHRRGSFIRPHFRHELASALAYLQSHSNDADDLVAYVIAAHHGRVRMSLRSLPGEIAPADGEGEALFARGVWHGDEMPAVNLGDGTRTTTCSLDLSPVRLGPGSWLERTVGLRDERDVGPFRLAWWETLLRISDRRGSAASQTKGIA